MLRMKKIAALLSVSCLLLAGCAETESNETKQASQAVAPKPVAKAASEEFKPILYIDTKAEAVCAENGGLKGCYGYAFECKDGLKTKVENVSCIDNQYVENKPEKPIEMKTVTDPTTLVKYPHEHCTRVSRAAEAIMASRLSGVSMSEVMEMAGGDKFLEGMVRDAYINSAYLSGGQAVVRDFADRAYSTCLDDLKRKQKERR